MLLILLPLCYESYDFVHVMIHLLGIHVSNSLDLFQVKGNSFIAFLNKHCFVINILDLFQNFYKKLHYSAQFNVNLCTF